MRGIYLFAFVCSALVSFAKDLTLRIDTTLPERNAFPCDAPCVGYAADPRSGDETQAKACRRAGAWLFHTSVCDDATLAFCAQYGLRLFLVLDGDQKTVVATLSRLARSPHKEALAGFQLGADPTGGANPAMWRQLAALVARQFPKCPIALPIDDLDSPLYDKMQGSFAPVTHLIVNLRSESAPYKKLERISGELRHSSDKAVAKLRLWAVGPGRWTGGVALPPVVWQMHWIMSALAVNRMDGVFVERPYRADDFGLVMRHFWAATTSCRSLVGHGEGATCAGSVQNEAKHQKGLPSDDDGGLGELELDDACSTTPAPVACENVIGGKPGDVEYLVLAGPTVIEEGRRICLVLVNTTGERVTLSLDVNKQGGDVASGWRSRLLPDREKGAMRESTRERSSRPFSETVEPNEVTFVDFRI